MSLLERARQHGTPLIDGTQVTFVYEGKSAPQLIGDFNYWLMDKSPIDFEQVENNLWQCVITLPIDAYIEYGLIIDGERTVDPLNPTTFADGFGHINNCFRMPEAHDSPLATLQPTVPHGTISTHTIDTRGYMIDATRTIQLYQPPTESATPLMIVFDGTGYIQRAKLPNIVDNLIVQKRIQPLSIAFLDPAGTGRTVEYACSDTTLAFLIQCVLPLANEHLKLIDISVNRGAYTIMGASMGGLMSLYAALRVPHIFGQVLSQSGAFRGENLYYESLIQDLIRYLPLRPLTIWMDAGVQEWFVSANRELFALLTEHTYNVQYYEHNSGHNYPSWRMSIARGLENLFPPAP